VHPARSSARFLKRHQPEAKASKKTLSVLTTQFAHLAPRSNKSKGKGQADEMVGEYQQLMDQEFYDFVVFDVPWIVS
jgi:V-type H+-transporting ATPase subunit C